MSSLTRTLLHASPLCSLALVRCHHPEGGPGREEETGWHSIDLPLSGVFVRHVAGRGVVGSAGSILFYNRGEVQRVSHPSGAGDRCLSLSVREDALRDALGGWDAAGREGAPFARTHLPADPVWAAALHRVRWRAAGGLELEETALLLVRALSKSLARESRRIPRRREARRRRRERVEGVQLLLAREPGRDWSLGELSRSVDCSPFHLSRSFTREVGISMHKWLLRQRLLLSLEPVAVDARRLVDVALDLGFSSHAHFTAAFGRAFGLSPSAFRASARRAALFELRKNLKA